MSINNRQITYGQLHEVFTYEWIFIDKEGKANFIQLRDTHFRNKKEISEFVKNCNSIEEFNDILKRYNMKTILVGVYPHFKIWKTSKLTKFDKEKVIKFSLDEPFNIGDDLI